MVVENSGQNMVLGFNGIMYFTQMSAASGRKHLQEKRIVLYLPITCSSLTCYRHFCICNIWVRTLVFLLAYCLLI